MQVISIAEMKRLEREAMDDGVPEFELMRRAGVGAAQLLEKFFRNGRFLRMVFLIGRGNNGGDALVAAAELFRRSIPIKLYAVSPLSELSGAAAVAASLLPEELAPEVRSQWNEFDFFLTDCVVDGLLGTGFSGALRPVYAQLISLINAMRLSVVALDIPSGIQGDSGNAESGIAVKAAQTITFGYPKIGLFRGDAPAYCGHLRCVPIGLPAPRESLMDAFFMQDFCDRFPERDWHCHKNVCGRCAVVAGSRAYSGAAVLNAEAALRGGAGLVELFSPGRPLAALPAAVIFHPLPGDEAGGFSSSGIPELTSALTSAQSLCAGSGWGNSSGLPALLECLLNTALPMVLDADGLNILARHPDLWNSRKNVIFTPHYGEALRLAAALALDVPADRREFAMLLSRAWNAVVVLKGAGTVVAAPDGRCSVNTSGDPALATAGSGDVLAGLSGALLANGMEPFSAACCAVFLHGLAGELGGCGLISDDLPRLLGRVLGYISRIPHAGCGDIR